jgi:hypothetical protein
LPEKSTSPLAAQPENPFIRDIEGLLPGMKIDSLAATVKVFPFER